MNSVTNAHIFRINLDTMDFMIPKEPKNTKGIQGLKSNSETAPPLVVHVTAVKQNIIHHRSVFENLKNVFQGHVIESVVLHTSCKNSARVRALMKMYPEMPFRLEIQLASKLKSQR